jgi:signal transduction histidine kinase
MKLPSRARSLLTQIPTLPLAALCLSTGKRLLIVVLSYALAIPSLWFFLPLTHYPVSMLLPIVMACWLFRYRGLLLNIPGILLTTWLVALYLSEYTVTSSQTFFERAVAGFAVGLVCSLVTCWLRTAVDHMLITRLRVLAAEQEHKLNKLRDQFLLNVNHELRTPLTVLTASLDLLEEHDEQLDAMERAGLWRLAKESHEELVGLVSQILDASHVMGEMASVQSEAICLQTLVHKEIVALSQRASLPYTMQVKVPEEVIVWADPKLLHHVLRHLLSNIFKYVPTQTEVTIAATPASSSSVCLWVQDAGPGIPAQERGLLFEKFARLKRDLAGTTRGIGLGLYISKHLVEAMGGRIWVESSGQPGEGSRFCVTLPAISAP